MSDRSETKPVFLGGTCGHNPWREALIAQLVERGVPADCLFNPVTANWNEETQRLEDRIKSNASFMLYYLGDPLQDDNRVSYYSLLEATMGLYDDPGRTVVVLDATGMPKHAEKATQKAYADLKLRFPDAAIFGTLPDAVEWLATQLL